VDYRRDAKASGLQRGGVFEVTVSRVGAETFQLVPFSRIGRIPQQGRTCLPSSASSRQISVPNIPDAPTTRFMVTSTDLIKASLIVGFRLRLGKA
jgi:hypothetical protein